MQSQTETFEQNAQEFWNIHGAFKTLHQINPARLQFIERYFSPAQKSIIDIGCGGGILSEALAEKGAKVSGIDLSPKVLEVAKEHALAQGLYISYRQISSRECAEGGEKYDAAVCM